MASWTVLGFRISRAIRTAESGRGRRSAYTHDPVWMRWRSINVWLLDLPAGVRCTTGRSRALDPE